MNILIKCSAHNKFYSKTRFNYKERLNELLYNTNELANDVGTVLMDRRCENGLIDEVEDMQHYPN